MPFVDQTETRNSYTETAATVAIGGDRLTVAIDCRCHNPICLMAALDCDPLCIAWIGRQRPVFYLPLTTMTVRGSTGSHAVEIGVKRTF